MIDECYVNPECRVRDTRLLNHYNDFVLEVIKVKIDPAMNDPRTLHHRGSGLHMISGESIELPSQVK